MTPLFISSSSSKYIQAHKTVQEQSFGQSINQDKIILGSRCACEPLKNVNHALKLVNYFC